MVEANLGSAWAARAQELAERGIIECRMCRRHEDLGGAFQLWRNGGLVFALCERCASTHDVLMRPTDRGIEIRAHRRGPLVIQPRECP